MRASGDPGRGAGGGTGAGQAGDGGQASGERTPST